MIDKLSEFQNMVVQNVKEEAAEFFSAAFVFCPINRLAVCGKSVILDAYRRWGHEPGSIEKGVAARHDCADGRTDDQGISMDAPYGAWRSVWTARGHCSGVDGLGCRTVQLCDRTDGPKRI